MSKAPAPAMTHPLRVADLPTRKPTRFSLTPSSAELKMIAAQLGLLDLRKLRFEGTLAAKGKSDWQLNAALGATVVQSCSVTLDPVTTRIDEDTVRNYATSLPEYEEASETEMPDDDNLDLLPATIDLAEVMLEALSIALPLYPRSENAALGEAVFTEEGTAPMRDEDTRPFAGLAALRDKLQKDD
ncbi:YceD family protein [Cochlodiniinecator piscidefendens]|uniref:YceD family protein n=1 Tax=Cochlodiniinecator piscidefendens TaxID=2715756 RepID=UPI0014082A0B|nr:DUF177 domain-containing protein [Cochlodiniinecator piscidefendens]